MPMISLTASFAREQPHINIALAEATETLPSSVVHIARYVLGHGGKRLRPLLTVFTARLFGYASDDIYSLAAAMEMFHVATLLHDDVMDNAELRRGQTATHKQYGVTEAILTGDALLAKGNQLIASFGDPRLTEAASDAILRTTAGEIMEIANQGKFLPNLMTYLDIIAGKTAWMIRTSCRIGALRAGVSEELVNLAAEYGYNIGMAFQVVDDILDFAPSRQTGKPKGGDLREGKLTPPIFFYIESLPADERERLLASFASLSFSEEELAHHVEAIHKHGSDKTWHIADAYLLKAREALTGMTKARQDSPQRIILAELIDHVRNRNA